MKMIKAWTALMVCAVLILCPAAVLADEYEFTDDDVTRIAKTLYGECRADDVPTDQKAAVVWCILNRLDSPDFPDTISEIVVYKQFHGYKEKYPVLEELEDIVRDVLIRYGLEKEGVRGVGRTLPPEYVYFVADGHGNKFSIRHKSKEYWDWSLPNPYEFGMINEVSIGD